MCLNYILNTNCASDFRLDIKKLIEKIQIDFPDFKNELQFYIPFIKEIWYNPKKGFKLNSRIYAVKLVLKEDEEKYLIRL